MTAALRHSDQADHVAEAARVLGKQGGQPKGSRSSQLAAKAAQQQK